MKDILLSIGFGLLIIACGALGGAVAIGILYLIGLLPVWLLLSVVGITAAYLIGNTLRKPV